MNILIRVLKKIKSTILSNYGSPRYFSKITEDYNWRGTYSKFCKTQKIENNWVFYESHAGASMLCNPLALFKEFQNRPDFKKYLHIWAIADDNEIEYLKNEYKHCKNVLFVKYQTVGYAYFVAKSKYLINNTSFVNFFAKRKGQVYLSTWHSITVKSLGYDTPDGVRLVKNMLRNLLMSDYIISPNEFMTDIFNNSFRLREIFQGKYIEEGFPRNDMVVKTDREKILKKLRDHGTVLDPNKKIILYAPTWNGNNVANPKIDINRYTAMLEHFNKTIDTDKYQLIIKPHQIEYRNLSKEQLAACKFISYQIDANSLLSIVDLVITDYSSIYFDYLVAQKPVLFYIPDFEEYKKSRGLYFSVDELPGPYAKTLDELSDFINNIDKVKEEYNEILDKTRAWACKYDDGNVSHKVLNILFDKNYNYNIKTAPKTKKSILIYPGSMATNGVTSAFLSLMKNINTEKYDVTAFILNSENPDINANIDKIPDHVRTFLRVGPPYLPGRDKLLYRSALKKGYSLDSEKLERLKSIMETEYVRLLGNPHFDYIIDFSGYGVYFPLLATIGCKDKDTKKIMWQHSDMKSEFTNTEKRELNNTKIDLDSIVANYEHFDKIVSATKIISEINRDNLATNNTYDKFTYASNLLDKERFDSLQHDTSCHVENETFYITHLKKESGFENITSFPLKKNTVKFVTMGRCMPEKNHENIINALKRLNDEGIDSSLYIIGEGLLREHLEKHAKKLGITNKVFLTGVMQNPFALLKQCDCFVFPSLYEAQGLSVLEARMVGLPIIISNYKAVSSVLIDDKQFITKDFDTDSIYEGMKAFIDGKIPSDYTFDIAEYNKNGMKEFEEVLN